jgi:hypothetical protein
MNQKIHSIKGYWRGRPQAVLHDGGRNVPAVATTNQKDWGSTISAKSSETDSTSTPWVQVIIPDDPTLVGKNVTCDLDMNVTYPAFTGGSNFQTTTSRMSRSVSLALAPTTGAGVSYNGWWWQGTVAGMAVMLVCTIILVKAARRLQRQAKPTRVLTPAAPAAV